MVSSGRIVPTLFDWILKGAWVQTLLPSAAAVHVVARVELPPRTTTAPLWYNFSWMVRTKNDKGSVSSPFASGVHGRSVANIPVTPASTPAWYAESSQVRPASLVPVQVVKVVCDCCWATKRSV